MVSPPPAGGGEGGYGEGGYGPEGAEPIECPPCPPMPKVRERPLMISAEDEPPGDLAIIWARGVCVLKRGHPKAVGV